MRVLHVLDTSFPAVSGYSARSASILQHQAAIGVEPVAVTGVRQEGGRDGDMIGGVVHRRTPAPAALAAARRTPLLREAVEMAALGRRVLALHREEPFDSIHAHSPVLCGLPAHAAARRLGLPFVYEVRAFWEDAAAHQGRGSPGSPRYAAARALETQLFRRADAVVALCDGIRRDLLDRGIPEDRVFVVPNGVDTARLSPLPRDEALADRLGFRDKIVVAYLGTLFRFEGVRLLLHALRRLVDTRPAVRGLIVGAGEASDEIRDLYADLDLGDRVVLTGRVPPGEAARYYAIADVLCYPRERHRITELTTPLKPLEAMSMGKAVVASDVGGLRELVDDGETGFLFQADDPVDLEAVLTRVVDDADLRRRAGERARAHVVAERDWRRITARYHEVYAAAAAAQSSRRATTRPRRAMPSSMSSGGRFE
jgi:PEP-CTERM/exosortase A-associated glycosyltransferase